MTEASVAFRFDGRAIDEDRMGEVVGNLLAVRLGEHRATPFEARVARVDRADRPSYYRVTVFPAESGLHLGLRREVRGILSDLGELAPETLDREFENAVEGGFDSASLTFETESSEEYFPLDLPDAWSLRIPLGLEIGTDHNGR
jgi:hypothetical protein